ncbi:AraC family transcriptional regulator [Nocardioides sp. SR21]|uniref:AraC family transcriptional regulator n=1 Tax=Nocardioides sp. SR21 TaxID=2919501 RepID=UPI001FAB123E|nr:AraC family transcriptional regulator [Nocardioides sp. SR21]
MTLIRGTSLTAFRELVAERGGDPDALLAEVGIPVEAIGDYGTFLDFPSVLVVIDRAAHATESADLGRELASRQGIEVLGSVGAAARSAPTVAKALSTIERYLRAYAPVLEVEVVVTGDRARFQLRRLIEGSMLAFPHASETGAGLSLGVLRHLIGPDWSPLRVELAHSPLSPLSEYEEYFGCGLDFLRPTTAFDFEASVLDQPVSTDAETHAAMVSYLQSIAPYTPQGVQPVVEALVRRLLPSGRTELGVVADELGMHPRTLQRRLEEEGITFAEVVQQVRRRTAEQYLRDSDMSLRHLATELGYLEQSTFTRACRRWFGTSPLAYRRSLRTHAGVT